jgi:3-oxoadipate CoA-transferase beta subunit
VSADGDLANWATDDAAMPPAVGGAMDLAVGARRVLVMTTHTTGSGRPKILSRCTYPLTAAGVVDRIFTDLAVLDVTPGGLLVREVVAGLGRDELRSVTGADLRFAADVVELHPTAPAPSEPPG